MKIKYISMILNKNYLIEIYYKNKILLIKVL